MIRIKVCGITCIADALAAVELGVNSLGFVFAQSPRRISPEQAVKISAEVQDQVAKVGVFVDEDAGVAREIADACGLDALQFHGGETPEYCRLFGSKAIKAFRVKDATSLHNLALYGAGPFLLDTQVDDLPGGTGRTFDWDLAAKATADYRIILSGGLNPDNVCEAIGKVKPYAVDVSSGVEDSPGRKNKRMLEAFVAAVRCAEEEA